MHVLSERLMRCNGYISGLKTDIAATKEERKKKQTSYLRPDKGRLVQNVTASRSGVATVLPAGVTHSAPIVYRPLRKPE